MATLELERWGPGGWDTLATLRFYRPESGLFSPVRLNYKGQDGYHCEMTIDDAPDEDDVAEEIFVPIISLPFVQWASPRVPGELFETYEGEPVAALLRDLIPSGWARRRLLDRLVPHHVLGQQYQDGPQYDVLLLQSAARSPIGHFRIKDPFRQDEGVPAIPLSVDGVGDRGWPHYGLDTHEWSSEDDPLWAGLGAGGENPKLLINQASDGLYYLDGNEPEGCSISDYWLVKWPREPVTRNREDILYAEYLYLKALGSLGFDVPEVRWQPHALWVRRFDRGPGGERYPVESLYNVMGLIGNGARLNHVDVLTAILPMASDPDAMLIEYLIRDHINRLLGNSDNHGRNTSFHRNFHGLELTPIYDVSPMVMDEDGIAWSTTWPTEWQKEGRPDWDRIIQHFAQSPQGVSSGLQTRSAVLSKLENTEAWLALPESVTRHPRILPPGISIGLQP